MPRKKLALSPTDIAQVRVNLSRRVSQIGNRLQANAMGELEDEMTAGQIRSAELIIKSVLPNQASVTQDITTNEKMSRDDMVKLAEAARQQIIESLTPDEIADKLGVVATQESVTIDRSPEELDS